MHTINNRRKGFAEDGRGFQKNFAAKIRHYGEPVNFIKSVSRKVKDVKSILHVPIRTSASQKITSTRAY